MLIAAAARTSQCGLAQQTFWGSAQQYFADLFSWCHWWAVFIASLGFERLQSLASVIRSLSLPLHLF